MVGSIEHLAEQVEKDLEQALPKQRKTQRKKLALLVSTMIQTRSANTMDLAAALPIGTERIDMRYQWISRFLGNQHVRCDEVMHPFNCKLIEQILREDKSLVLIIDQTKINDTSQALVVAARWGERAIPLAWTVEATGGGIAYSSQKKLLDFVTSCLPEKSSVVLMGDRFYGTSHLIRYCDEKGWDYRLRLRDNLCVFEEGGEAKTKELVKSTKAFYEGVLLTKGQVRTNIAVIHEKDHEEPWIIAMKQKPGNYQALDYGLRWGIEAMFSDFKSRGFGLSKSHLIYPDRVERLILVMAIALCWATLVGAHDAQEKQLPYEKKMPRKLAEAWYRGLSTGCAA